MCRAPLKISLLSGLPVEILQLQLQNYNLYMIAVYRHAHFIDRSRHA